MINAHVAYGCEAFSTRDRRSILKNLPRAAKVPLDVMSPADWGELLIPHLGWF